MPVIRLSEQSVGVPCPPVESLARTIRRQWQPAAKGGPVFVIVGCTGLGSLKVLERFSLTQEWWRNAWHALVRQDLDAAGKVRMRLNEREREQRELDQRFGQTTELVEANPRSFGCPRQVALLVGYRREPIEVLASGSTYGATGG
jgi:anti-sigma factor RsiW